LAGLFFSPPLLLELPSAELFVLELFAPVSPLAADFSAPPLADEAPESVLPLLSAALPELESILDDDDEAGELFRA
jgi:hypothetical protein